MPEKATPMKLKTIDVNGTTYAAVQDGKPIYIGEDGKEVAFDAPHTIGTITRLNSEAKGHRERAEAIIRTVRKNPGRGRPAQETWLTKKQALYLCTKS